MGMSYPKIQFRFTDRIENNDETYSKEQKIRRCASQPMITQTNGLKNRCNVRDCGSEESFLAWSTSVMRMEAKNVLDSFENATEAVLFQSPHMEKCKNCEAAATPKILHANASYCSGECFWSFICRKAEELNMTEDDVINYQNQCSIENGKALSKRAQKSHASGMDGRSVVSTRPPVMPSKEQSIVRRRLASPAILIDGNSSRMRTTTAVSDGVEA